jgi:hypothetical protein
VTVQQIAEEKIKISPRQIAEVMFPFLLRQTV